MSAIERVCVLAHARGRRVGASFVCARVSCHGWSHVCSCVRVLGHVRVVSVLSLGCRFRTCHALVLQVVCAPIQARAGGGSHVLGRVLRVL